MTDFGQCWSCVTDLSMPSTMAKGFQCVGEAIARRWQTPRGGLLDDPNYGYDLSGYVNDDLDTGDLPKIAFQAGMEARKDERVLSCAVTITLNLGVMVVSALVSTADGPFQLVVSVSDVSVQLLQVKAQ